MAGPEPQPAQKLVDIVPVDIDRRPVAAAPTLIRDRLAPALAHADVPLGQGHRRPAKGQRRQNPNQMGRLLVGIGFVVGVKTAHGKLSGRHHHQFRAVGAIPEHRPGRLLVAAWLGRARLIDNISVIPGTSVVAEGA